jgi:sugar-specific transcriptional regulator TrmB
MELPDALKDLGFTDKEAAIYLALLQAGRATAYQVAAKSGLKKPTAYVILDGLVQRGAARRILKGRGTQYAATDPVEVFVEARSRVSRAESALPRLRALATQEKKVVETSYYEGLDGLKEMYRNLLNETAGKTLDGFFASEKDTPPELSVYWRELNAEMVQRRVAIRAITTKDETTRPYLEGKILPKELLSLRGLPPNIYDSDISIEIYGDCTQIVSHRYVQGLLIRNPDIARVMKQIFEIAWKTGGPGR